MWYIFYAFCFFFFFQAEDGIRDTSVTGVQTCALPIYRRQDEDIEDGEEPVVEQTGEQVKGMEILKHEPYEIGRASCRERV